MLFSTGDKYMKASWTNDPKSCNQSCLLVLTSKSTYLLYESKKKCLKTGQYNVLSTPVELHPCKVALLSFDKL